MWPTLRFKFEPFYLFIFYLSKILIYSFLDVRWGPIGFQNKFKFKSNSDFWSERILLKTSFHLKYFETHFSRAQLIIPPNRYVSKHATNTFTLHGKMIWGNGSSEIKHNTRNRLWTELKCAWDPRKRLKGVKKY